MRHPERFLLYVAVIICFGIRLCLAQMPQDPPLANIQADAVAKKQEIAGIEAAIAALNANPDIQVTKHDLDLYWHQLGIANTELGAIDAQIGTYYGAIADPTPDPEPTTPPADFVGLIPRRFEPQHGGTSGDYFADLAHRDYITHTIRTSGNWSTVAASIPEKARILIPADVVVVYDASSPKVYKSIAIGGALRFSRTANTVLNVGTIQNDGVLDVGTMADPIPQGKTCDIHFRDKLDVGTNAIAEKKGEFNDTILVAAQPMTLGNDPDQRMVGIVSLGGTFTVNGFFECPAVMDLGTKTLKGVTTLPVTPGSCWQVGDTLGIAPSQTYSQESFRNIDQFEYVKIKTLSPLTIEQPLKYDHEAWCKVGHLSRNVRLWSHPEGGNTAAHVMICGDTMSEAGSFEEHDFGRTTTAVINDTLRSSSQIIQIGTNQRGNYDWHWHHAMMAGKLSKAVFFHDIATRNDLKWSIAVHNTHATLNDNIVLNVAGAGIVAENGGETGISTNGWVHRGRYLDATGARSIGLNTNGSSEDYKEFGALDALGKPLKGIGRAGYGAWLRTTLFKVDGLAVTGECFEGVNLEVEDPWGDMVRTLPPVTRPTGWEAYEGRTLAIRQISPLQQDNMTLFCHCYLGGNYTPWGVQGVPIYVKNMKVRQWNGNCSIHCGHSGITQWTFENLTATNMLPASVVQDNRGWCIGNCTDYVQEVILKGTTTFAGNYSTKIPMNPYTVPPSPDVIPGNEQGIYPVVAIAGGHNGTIKKLTVIP